MNTNRPLSRPVVTAGIVLTGILLVSACGERNFTPIADPAAVATTEPATPEPAAPAPSTVPATSAPSAVSRAPGIHAAVSARQALTVSEANLATLGAAVTHDPSEPPTADVVAVWLADLARLERALDAEAIRALGDDPLFEQIAGPVGELDAATIRVIALLDPPIGEPDILGALVEVRSAVAAWEAAVPGMEEAWEDAVARWTAEWETAVGDWEQEWATAVAEWESEWAAAVAEWEAEWEAATAEWEQAWEDAVAEWQAEQERRRAERRGETDG